MVALRPSRLSHVEAASAPVIAVTAWQMLFEYGNAKPNQTVMILEPLEMSVHMQFSSR